MKLLHKCETLPRSATHAVKQVQQTIWQITSFFPTPTNCWLVQSNDGLTLIDAAHPWSANLVLSTVKALNQPLRRIIITHAHPDHAGAAGEIAEKTDAIVFAHEADVPYLQGHTNLADEKGFWACRMILGTAQRLGITAPPVGRVQPLVDGEMIANLHVIHTPGHTPGSISLWAGDEKAIFSGDNLLYRMRTLHVGVPLFTLDRDKQNASLRRYVDLPARMLMAGHGPVFTGDIPGAIKRLL